MFSWGYFAGKAYLDADGITMVVEGDPLRDAELAYTYETGVWTREMIRTIGENGESKNASGSGHSRGKR